MIDLVKKAMFTGIGMLSLTKEKIEETARDFAEKGKMSEAEGKKFVSEFVEKSEESKQELKKQIESIAKKTLQGMDVASKTDLASVRKELTELKKKIEEKG